VRLVAVCAAVTATVALTHSTASGAFSGSAVTSSNSVGTASSFCTATPTTLYPVGDSWTEESNTALNNVNDTGLRLRSSSAGDRRVWIRFTLPAIPARCDLTQAVLSVYNNLPVASRTVDVYRGDPAAAQWTSAGITWGNQPAGIGTGVGSATPGSAAWQTWTVTAHVAAQYAGGANGNNGFVLRDRTENSATAREQVYSDLQTGATAPNLVLTWG
jgi:hypothetical protein